MELNKICPIPSPPAAYWCRRYWKNKVSAYRDEISIYDNSGDETIEFEKYMYLTGKRSFLNPGEGPFYEEWILRGARDDEACAFRDICNWYGSEEPKTPSVCLAGIEASQPFHRNGHQAGAGSGDKCFCHLDIRKISI
jgi:hypothetical protein